VSDTISLRTDRLKALRKQRGWSQRELARFCGLGETIVNKYERAVVDPSASTLKIMAEKLDVSADYLLGLTDDPQGCSDIGELTDDERIMVHAFRRDSWPGVIRIAADHITR
jgi:transcriptional regulator with XRE-family HTH domain